MKDLGMYDIGELKNDPWKLYDLAVKFSMVYDSSCYVDSELFEVFEKVSNSLWGNLPNIVTIDFTLDA